MAATLTGRKSENDGNRYLAESLLLFKNSSDLLRKLRVFFRNFGHILYFAQQSTRSTRAHTIKVHNRGVSILMNASRAPKNEFLAETSLIKVSNKARIYEDVTTKFVSENLTNDRVLQAVLTCALM